MWHFRRQKLDIGFIIFELTDACNQACRFCYNHFKGGEGLCTPPAPDFKAARKTLRALLSEANIGSISLTGGEPMLTPRIHDLVLRARLSGSKVNILTNGTLLRDDDIAIFDQLGVSTIQIPLLSHLATEHDYQTQLAGSWERATAAARKVVARRDNWLTPVFILSRLNSQSIEPTLEMYAAMGAKRIMLNRFNIGGLGRKYADELVLSHAELRDAFRRADTKLGELGMSAHNGVCTPMCLLDPKEYTHISFSHCTTELHTRPLTVNYRGDVRFCNHSPRVLGNIHKERLSDIIARSSNSGYYDNIPSACSACKLWERCRGGCRAAAEQLYGTFDRVDPVLEQPYKK